MQVRLLRRKISKNNHKQDQKIPNIEVEPSIHMPTQFKRSGYITGEYFFHFSLIRIVIELFQMIFQGCTHLIHEKGCLELNGARDIAPRTLQDNLHQN